MPDKPFQPTVFGRNVRTTHMFRTQESGCLKLLSRRFLLPSLALVIFGVGACSGQRDEPVPAHDAFTIESRETNESRQINVYLPPDYGKTNTMRYPVLYMPDGGVREDFPHIATTIDIAIRAGEMQPIVMVGIENTERRRDMTGPTEVPEDRKVAPHVGGSAAFRAFISKELVPQIHTRYRVTDESGIIGESAAGLFIVETFFLQPELFDKYIAISPSIWWNNEELVRRAGERLQAHQDMDIDLYLSSANEDDVVPPVSRLAEILRSDAPPGLRWQYEPRPDLRHNNIYRSVSPQVLRRFYAAKTALREASKEP